MINANRKEKGMPMATSMPERRPTAATTTVSTRNIAVEILPCRVLICSTVSGAWSAIYPTATLPGYWRCRVSTTVFTLATASTRETPLRFDTSTATAGMPLARVKVVASLKVRRMVVTSRKVTTPLAVAVMGMDKTSSADSIRLGILTLKLPRPVSTAPAAIRRLLRATAATNWSLEMP